MKFFDKNLKEREIIKKYHRHYEIYKKNLVEFENLQEQVSNLQAKYKREIAALISKRNSLHDSNTAILKARNTINMIAYPKVLSKEEYDSYNTFMNLNETIHQLKNKLEKGYEILLGYDENEPTTYMFAYQKTGKVESYKIFSKSDKTEMENEIKILQAKLELFTPEQVNFFENKIGWSEDISKRLKRFKQYDEDHSNCRESVFRHIDVMKTTKKELGVMETQMKSFYEEKIKTDRELLEKMYSGLSAKNQKNLDKKQKIVAKDDFSM